MNPYDKEEQEQLKKEMDEDVTSKPVDMRIFKANLRMAQDPETFKKMREISINKAIQAAEAKGDNKSAERLKKAITVLKKDNGYFPSSSALKYDMLKYNPEAYMFASVYSKPDDYEAAEKQINYLPDNATVTIGDILNPYVNGFVFTGKKNIFIDRFADIKTLVHEGEHTGQSVDALGGGYAFYNAAKKFKEENPGEFDKVFRSGNALRNEREVMANLVDYESRLGNKSLFDTPFGKYLQDAWKDEGISNRYTAEDPKEFYYNNTMRNVNNVSGYEQLDPNRTIPTPTVNPRRLPNVPQDQSLFQNLTGIDLFDLFKDTTK